MRLLLDTHVLVWVAEQPSRILPTAQALIEDPANDLFFSSASIWELALKANLARAPRPDDLQADSRLLQRQLIANGYTELPVTGDHGVTAAELPPIHKDPFDRILIAQAEVEGLVLLTADSMIWKYHTPFRRHIEKI